MSFPAKTAMLNRLDLAISNLVSIEIHTMTVIEIGDTGGMKETAIQRAGTMHLHQSLSSGNHNGMEEACAYPIEDGTRHLEVAGMLADMERVRVRDADGMKLLVPLGSRRSSQT
jgi:ribosome-binding ATPase YchF (GTP1/OBG family)